MKSVIRKMLLGLVALVALCLFLHFAISLGRRPAPGVTAENFKYLYKGMTEEEVEMRMGGRGELWGRVTLAHCTIWRGQDCEIHIWFGVDATEGEMIMHDGVHVQLPERTKWPWWPW
jgi:hypothetical protein